MDQADSFSQLIKYFLLTHECYVTTVRNLRSYFVQLCLPFFIIMPLISILISLHSFHYDLVSERSKIGKCFGVITIIKATF